MHDREALGHALDRIDGRSYRAYRDIRGRYDLGEATLFVDHVQSDPFATPSKLRVRIPGDRAAIPSDLFEGRTRRIALCDFLARSVRKAIAENVPPSRGSGKSGRGKSEAHSRPGTCFLHTGSFDSLTRKHVLKIGSLDPHLY